MDLHQSCRNTFLAEEFLDVQTRGGADLFDLLAAFSDHDRFLGIPFDHDRGVNAGHLVFFFEFIDPDRSVIRKFLAQKMIEFFPDHLLHMETDVLVGKLILGINEFSLGKVSQGLLDQRLDVLPRFWR